MKKLWFWIKYVTKFVRIEWCYESDTRLWRNHESCCIEQIHAESYAAKNFIIEEIFRIYKSKVYSTIIVVVAIYRKQQLFRRNFNQVQSRYSAEVFCKLIIYNFDFLSIIHLTNESVYLFSFFRANCYDISKWLNRLY